MADLELADTAPLDAYAAVKTPNFSPREWCSSHMLAEPYPVAWLIDRWVPLAKVLELIRAEVGASIRITPSGGYRCPAHNAAIGGAAQSQHMQGRAADIVTDAMSPDALHALISDMADKLPRLSGLGSYPGFTHIDVGDPVSIAMGHVRRWAGGRTVA